MLGGYDAQILKNPRDLVSLCQPVNEDRLTRFIRHYFAFILVVSFSFNGIQSLVTNARGFRNASKGN